MLGPQTKHRVRRRALRHVAARVAASSASAGDDCVCDARLKADDDFQHSAARLTALQAHGRPAPTPRQMPSTSFLFLFGTRSTQRRGLLNDDRCAGAVLCGAGSCCRWRAGTQRRSSLI